VVSESSGLNFQICMERTNDCVQAQSVVDVRTSLICVVIHRLIYLPYTKSILRHATRLFNGRLFNGHDIASHNFRYRNTNDLSLLLLREKAWYVLSSTDHYLPCHTWTTLKATTPCIKDKTSQDKVVNRTYRQKAYALAGAST
jgi:hypothetical protein